MTVYRIKEGIDLIDFLKAVKSCRDDVLFEAETGDRLNLKSVLSQYVFVSLHRRPDLFGAGIVRCTDRDRDRIEKYLQKKEVER